MFNKLWSDVPFNIEYEILNLATKDTKYLNVAEAVKREVYNKYVIDINDLSCNTIRAREDELIITDIYDEPVGTRYRVPDTLLRGRQLVDVLVVAAGYKTEGTDPNGGEPMTKMLRNTAGFISGFHSHEIELVSDNEFIVYGLAAGTFELNFTYSKTLNELSRKVTPTLSEGFILLLKAWIKVKLSVKLNQGAIYHGHELSSVTNIVSDYNNAFEDYLTFKKELLGKSLFMDSSREMDNFIKGMTGNVF